MKILTYKTDAVGIDPKTAVILRSLERAVCNFDYIVERGWRFILEMQGDDEEQPYYVIDVQSNRGGGSYAEAKMSTLRDFSGELATGYVDLNELKNMVLDIATSEHHVYDALLGEIKMLDSFDPDSEDARRLSTSLREALRDELGITFYKGGIRFLYQDLRVIADGAGGVKEENGEIRMSFSGASEEQDLFFALMVFRSLKGSFVDLYPNIQGWFNIRDFDDYPEVKYYIDILGIKEA